MARTESEMAIEQQREKQHVGWRHKTAASAILLGVSNISESSKSITPFLILEDDSGEGALRGLATTKKQNPKFKLSCKILLSK